MGWLIGIAVFTLVVGYAVRDRKSRLRRRSYYHRD
jgi:general stress protein CsbA